MLSFGSALASNIPKAAKAFMPNSVVMVWMSVSA